MALSHTLLGGGCRAAVRAPATCKPLLTPVCVAVLSNRYIKMSGKAGHPAYFDPQDQKAYMKQPAVFANKKDLIAKGLKRAPRCVLWLRVFPRACAVTCSGLYEVLHLIRRGVCGGDSVARLAARWVGTIMGRSGGAVARRSPQAGNMKSSNNVAVGESAARARLSRIVQPR